MAMAHGYLTLKLSWELFHKAPEALSAPERTRLAEVAGRQDHIEHCILASPEAANIVIPSATLAARLADIEKRYAGPAEFAADLERSDLDRQGFENAVERDLRVEAVLDRIAAGVPAVTAVDAEIYYRLHPEAFDRPEARRLRHILVTFDNAREKAKAAALLDDLRGKLPNAEAFGEAALRHSQCPTAMEGGQLGVVKRQQLYADLEPAAFALVEGEISPLLESPIGLHILRCDEIFPSGLLPFPEVRQKIIDRLADRRRQETQRTWIKDVVARVQGKRPPPGSHLA